MNCVLCLSEDPGILHTIAVHQTDIQWKERWNAIQIEICVLIGLSWNKFNMYPS
jgi:hypothetical protein